MNSNNVNCPICQKPLSRSKSLKCNLCNNSSHFKCYNLRPYDFQTIEKNNTNWHCYLCAKDIFPFAELENNRFNAVTNNNSQYSVENERLVLHPPPNLSSLYNHFNNISNDTNKDPENVANCKYYEIEELSRLFSETLNDNS